MYVRPLTEATPDALGLVVKLVGLLCRELSRRGLSKERDSKTLPPSCRLLAALASTS